MASNIINIFVHLIFQKVQMNWFQYYKINTIPTRFLWFLLPLEYVPLKAHNQNIVFRVTWIISPWLNINLIQSCYNVEITFVCIQVQELLWRDTFWTFKSLFYYFSVIKSLSCIINMFEANKCPLWKLNYINIVYLDILLETPFVFLWFSTLVFILLLWFFIMQVF